MAILRVLLILLIYISASYAEVQRIVSVAPNVTETLYYLGAGDKVVAVSDFCNWPTQVKDKPKIGGMLNPSFEKILALKPDLVVISRDGTPKEVYQKLIDLRLNVYVFSPKSLRDIPQEVTKLGRKIGKTREAKAVVKDFTEQLKKIKKSFNNEKALFVIWEEPLVVAGKSSHLNEIMEMLGLKNIAEFSSINLETLIKLNPDIIFFGSGHEFTSHRLLSQLKDTNAVKKGYVYYVSDKVYHLSPRIIEGIKEMAEIGYNLNNEKRISTSKNKKQ